MSSERAENAFLRQYLKDQVAGTSRSLEEYQALFPGQDALVAGSLAELEAAGAPATPGGTFVDRIGSYRILGEIGRGGQGVVYLAEDERLHRKVALKMLSGLGSLAPESVARFLREAEVASRLDHPGIATVYDTGTEDGIPYIAMKYVEGDTLKARIAASEGTIVETTRIVEMVARALDAAHRKGVIHRDIKPGNIVVTREGDPVILDFGLAHDADSDVVSITRTGDFSGTPAYMSPEQIAVQKMRPDARTDVWSLGVTLYECLTFRRPFEAPTREGLYNQILTGDPPDAGGLNRAIPPDLGIVLQTALEKDVDRRYQTALAFAEELRRVRLHEPIVARPVGPFVRLRRWAQRNPGLAVAVGGLFLVLAIGLGIALFLLGQRDRAVADLTSERNAKNALLSDYDRLGDSSRLQRLLAEADLLWPCEPSKGAAMRSWVEQGADLEKRLPGHREVLARMSAASRPIGGGAGASSFASTAEQFRHDTTAKLVADLEAFADPDPRIGLLADVRARLEFSETVERDTIALREAQWGEAVRSIADVKECPKYGGLRIKPQLGLIPIGRDAKSGLWEFVHLQTTAPGADPVPTRGKDGKLVITGDVGLVFVLLPGGTFRMGAVKPDEDTTTRDPNVDPDAADNEAPVTEVTLDPFFMSKYELTQGQWLRLVGKNPSGYGAGGRIGEHIVGLTNPLEQINWEDCNLWLGRLGLVLPTEAQWEYAARGGSTTPRWTGVGTEGLDKAENLADLSGKDWGGIPNWKHESWSDGHAVHAPVGSFVPNPFGLHDVLGNVREWCRDAYGSYDVKPRPGDALRSPPGSHNHVYRGASYYNDAWYARSAFRSFYPPTFRNGNVGLRPAMERRR